MYEFDEKVNKQLANQPNRTLGIHICKFVVSLALYTAATIRPGMTLWNGISTNTPVLYFHCIHIKNVGGVNVIHSH